MFESRLERRMCDATRSKDDNIFKTETMFSRHTRDVIITYRLPYDN